MNGATWANRLETKQPHFILQDMQTRPFAHRPVCPSPYSGKEKSQFTTEVPSVEPTRKVRNGEKKKRKNLFLSVP